MNPPKGPRQPSRPELPIDVDKVVGAGTSYAASQDHVRPELARRSQTLSGLGAVKPSPPIPPAPAVPRVAIEGAATVPAPNPLRHQTIRRPPPPSATTAARRSSPPPSFDEQPTSIQVTGAGPTPGGQLGASTLPPASQDPDSGAQAALRRELAKAKQATEAAEAETKRLELELAAKDVAAEQAAKQKPTEPDRIWGIPLRNALIAFMAAVTALGAPATVWLTARAESAKQEAARQAIITAQLQQQVASAQASKTQTASELTASKAELVAQRVYYREVFRLMGVEIPKHPGDPDPGDLKPVTPLCPRGRVCAGPQIVVTVPP